MIDFIYKSFLSLFVLLAVYHLVLEREKMHHFNRFYLLFSLVFSLILPFITIEVVTETIAPVQQTYKYVVENIPIQNKKVLEQSQNYTFIILWSLYGLVTSVLLFRYIRNVAKIVSIIKSNPIIDDKKVHYVLLDESILPHTFLNYIFFNKAAYQNQKIEKELFRHEMIHVTQKHTLDILLIETLKAIFWFNPLFIFYKKAIQLNHEFLADENVVNSFKDVSFYQNLLLAYNNTNSTSGLTSNLNYSITKKRFIMMTKTVSKTRILISKMAVLPLFTGLIFFICTESNGQISIALNSVSANYKITEGIHKSNSGWNVSAGKNEYRPAKQPEIMMSSAYSLKGMKINEAAFRNTMERISTYILSTYESPKGIDKKQEIAKIAFFLKKDGSLADIKIIDEKGTKTETEIVHILKVDTKFIPEKKYGNADWNPIAIQMDFWPMESNDAMSFSSSIIEVVGHFCIPGTNSLASVDVKPEFPGGIDKLNGFISENFIAPKDCSSGKLEIGFVVETDGSISNFSFINETCQGATDEAIRVLKTSPTWKSGEKDGKAVRTSYVLQIPISANKK